MTEIGRPTGALGVFLSALLQLFSLGCLAATICAFSGTDDYYLETVIAVSLCDGSYRMGDRSTVSRRTLPPSPPRGQ